MKFVEAFIFIFNWEILFNF